MRAAPFSATDRWWVTGGVRAPVRIEAPPAPKRQSICGWSIRWNEEFARRMRREGWWSDDTIAAHAARVAQATPDRVVVIEGGRRFGAGELHDRASRLAAALIRRGLVPGDVVSLMLPNWHEAAVIYLAAAMAGLVTHPIAIARPENDLASTLADVGSRMIFTAPSYDGGDLPAMLDSLRPQLPQQLEIVVVRGKVKRGARIYRFDDLQSGAACPEILPVIDPDSVKTILYTTSTRGPAKGVLHSHNSVHAVLRQLQAEWSIRPGSRMFIANPISHGSEAIFAFDGAWLSGSTVVLQEQWCSKEAIRIIESEQCTHIAATATVLYKLLSAARAARTGLPSLRLFACLGSTISEELVREAQAHFANCTVMRVFGSTEIPCTTVGAPTPGEVARAIETDGRVGFAEIKLVDADGKPRESEGEICARAPQMLVGYLWTADERPAFDDEGYFRTGVLARRVDGDYLVITGRVETGAVGGVPAAHATTGRLIAQPIVAGGSEIDAGSQDEPGANPVIGKRTGTPTR